MQQLKFHCSLLLTPLTLIYARWLLCSQSWCIRKPHRTISGNFPLVGTWDIPLTKIETADSEICWQNVNLLTRKICCQNLLTTYKSADRSCWQKPNLLTTKKPCRLNASKPLLKTSRHTSQATAGTHIPSVKFNAWTCAWTGPSSITVRCRYTAVPSSASMHLQNGVWSRTLYSVVPDTRYKYRIKCRP
jgi:hypothetical protein